jgi:hypothetical protein
VSRQEIAETNRAKVQLRRASFADYAQIVELQTRNGLNTRSYADWCALWSKNPAYSEPSQPIGWVLESSGGTIVGFLGNLPIAYTFRGRDLAAVTGHSWVVDQRYRGHSVVLLDTLLKQANTDLFVFATVNATAEPVLRAFGLKRVPVGDWDSARFWITGYRGFSASVLAARSISRPDVWSVPLAGVFWLKDRLAQFFSRGAGFESNKFQVEMCTEFDDRFQGFWREMKRRNTDRLLAVRDQETLSWHYGSTQCQPWIVAASIQGILVGYWTVDRQDHPDLGLRRLRFVDFQALPEFQDLLRLAVSWTLAQAQKDGIHIVEDTGGWLERFGVKGTTGPYRRQTTSWRFYYLAKDPDLAKQLLDPSVWAPSSFDGDASV